MSKLTVLLDNGHGGIINNEYQTAGKRSPKRSDGTVLYEGVNNRRIVKQLKWAFLTHGIEFIDIVDSEKDISLSERVRRANEVEGDTLYLSIHSNAAGRDGNFTNAKGFGTYIYTGAGKQTREYAKIIHKNLGINLSELTKDRGIKERDFFVLRKSSMSAILLELGFHDNEEESFLIESNEWSQRVVKALVDAILEIQKS